MQISPVQPRSIIYRRVHVTPLLDERGETFPDLKAPNFDWSDVKLDVQTSTGFRADDHDPTEFLASLAIRVPNSEGARCPYNLDVEIVALLHLSPKLPLARREDLANVNGLALAYGALRELVMNLTARMEYGALVMPGVNFQDQAKGDDVPAAVIGTTSNPGLLPPQPN